VVGQRLALPLAPVSPIRLCPLPSPLYTVLMGYKESPIPEARARFTPIVRGLFDDYFARHAPRLAVDMVLAVPSTARPSGAPLARVPGLGDHLEAQLGARWCDDLLCRGPGELGHMHPQRDGFVVPANRRGAVQGRHLLVLDDTYVSGARAQSAAGALRLAGAASVRIVIAGRVLRPDRVPGHAAFLRRHALSSTAPAPPAPDGWAQTEAPSG
jgi:hypothetical protein